jgi:hypothetical protein
LIWIATFISGLLTYAQLKILPVAIQISIPVLFWVYLETYKNISLQRTEQGVNQSTLE